MGLRGLVGAGVGSGMGAGMEASMDVGRGARVGTEVGVLGVRGFWWAKSAREDASHFLLDVQEGVGPVMLQFLKLHCLKASRALSGGGAVAGTTKQTVVLPVTPVSVMVTTAFPVAGTPIAGNVAVAKQEAAGAVHDWEGVGSNMVDHVSYGHPLREGPTEFQMYGQVWDSLSVLVMVWEA
ncbi:hypothetical protein E2C01_060201 [Portunus trituberculatus]|uniref:Uncharacterized protein n=1 Tax=Portunus trituberculatus TaxID=210409 RepID=A0A5B7HAQ2_PORTR|nr:hypothetical protein [Portunus trituberculatus]